MKYKFLIHRAIWPMCILTAVLSSMAVGCQSNPSPSSSSGSAKFSPTGGASDPKVEEASLIKAVENNGHIPPEQKPKIIQQIKAQFKMAAKIQAKKRAELAAASKSGTMSSKSTAP